MNPIFACTTSAEDWSQFLARPGGHWKQGYSAHALATAWQEATGLPAEVSRVMATVPELTNAEPLIGIPEYRVPLPGGRRASQSDLLVLGRAPGGAFAMVVEGKVAESFGPLVHEWLAKGTPGRLLRWSFLCNLLKVDGTKCRDLRYQLFHRTASAVLAAELHHSPTAILLVHSFSSAQAGFPEYATFLSLFGAHATQDTLVRLGVFQGRELFAGWVNGAPRIAESGRG